MANRSYLPTCEAAHSKDALCASTQDILAALGGPAAAAAAPGLKGLGECYVLPRQVGRQPVWEKPVLPVFFTAA